MRTPVSVASMASVAEVKIDKGQLQLRGTFTLRCPMPEQNEELPKRLEQAIEAGGQAIKRRLFQQALEHADLELLLEQRQGKDGQGFQRRGSKPYPFKTIFGSVRVRRRRIMHKADGASVVPSAQVWQTPDEVCLTPGLREAVCDGMLAQSARQTVARIEERAGAAKLIGCSEVVNIVHEEGCQLQEALPARAAAVFAHEVEAARLLLPTAAESDPSEAAAAVEFEEAALACAAAPEEESVAADLRPPLGFPGSLAAAAAVAWDQPRQVDADGVLVEPDAVVVPAQPGTGQKKMLEYTAVVMAAAQTWYLCAATPAVLQRLVGGVLACLGVHRGERRLWFLADGARWMRNWLEGLLVAGTVMILCWYHLVKRCEQGLSMACRGRAHREQVQVEVLGHWWHGRVSAALAVLQNRRGEMKNEEALDELIGYVEARRAYLPD